MFRSVVFANPLTIKVTIKAAMFPARGLRLKLVKKNTDRLLFNFLYKAKNNVIFDSTLESSKL